MKHAALYRKWRPRRMGEIVGQEPVVRTLSRAIETDRVAHAYLFSGPRGTGKTSTAKVLAMGLNCQGSDGPTPEPDGTCESCRAIRNNSSLDVVEMDAASNRGIDEIRDLRDRVNLAPVAGRMKVYIIDEVHMLTPEAFNALLKMLEEPPEHVVFVLATTEKHKVLPTIISRCQSFDFRRPSVDTLSAKLSEIAEAEDIEAEPEALTVIARAGGGSFRDAEGLLDQLSSFGEGKVTAAAVRELLGSVGPEALLETTDALYERRSADALRIVDRLSNDGRDLGQFVGELLSHLRTLMLLPHAPEVALAEVGAEERAALEEQAGRVPTVEVVRLIEALGDTLGRVKRGGDPKLEVELSFLKLTRDYTEPPVENLLRRLEALELAVESGVKSGGAGSAPQKVAQDTPLKADEAAAEASEIADPEDEATDDGAAEPQAAGADGERQEERAEAEVRWDEVIRDLKERRQALTAAVYGEARVEGFDGKVLRIVFPEEQGFHVGMAKDRKHVEELGKVLESRLGSKPRLEVRASGEAGDSGAAVPVTWGAEPEPEVPQSGPSARPPDPQTTPEIDGGVDTRPNGGTPASEAAGGDGTIRSEAEAFEVARELGLFGQEKGS